MAARASAATGLTVHPEIVLGDLRIDTHLLFSALGLLVGLALYYRALRGRGLLGPTVVWVSLAVLVGGVVGARLVLAWDHLDDLRSLGGLSLMTAIERSGKSLIGAIVGGYVAGFLAKRALGYRELTGDCYALALAVGVAIGRVGCLLSELPLGVPTGLSVGVSVAPEAAARFASCPGCELPMHPVMLYEIAFNAVAALLIVRYGRRVPVRGDLLKLYLVAGLSFRFANEWLRAEDADVFGLTGPQLVLVPVLAALYLHFARSWRRHTWSTPLPPPYPAGRAAAPG